MTHVEGYCMMMVVWTKMKIHRGIKDNLALPGPRAEEMVVQCTEKGNLRRGAEFWGMLNMKYLGGLQV